MRRSLLLGAALALLATFGTFAAGRVSAAPPGAAAGLSVIEQTCAADGTVRATMTWLPSGRGQQWVDLARVNNNFTTNYSRGGPFAASLNIVTFTQMRAGVTYYARVVTQAGPSSTFLISDTLAFTANCPRPGTGGSTGGIAPPTGLTATPLSTSSVQFRWAPGAGNIWFCLNTATSVGDLQVGGPSWRNHGCWSTSNNLVVQGLACGTTYYWNVYTWNHTVNTTSGMSSVRTPACPGIGFTAPGGLEVLAVTDTRVQLSWQPGLNNWWYCVYMATNVNDLINGGVTQRNYGCWSSQTSLVVQGLTCGTTYYWNVHAWNPSASAISTLSWFTTRSCDAGEVAPIDGISITKVGSSYLAQIVVGLPNGCHSPGTYSVERSGARVEVTVLNKVSNALVCTQIYGTYNLVVNLGSNFVPGQTYRVDVNEERIFFVAS